MTNPRRETIQVLLKLCDLAVVISAFVLAICVVSSGVGHWFSVLDVRVKLRNFIFIAAYVGYCHTVLRSLGLYRSYRLSPSSAELRDLTVAVLGFALPIVLLKVPLRLAFATALFLAAFVIFVFVGLAVERRLLRVLARTMRRYGRNLRNAIIVGNSTRALDAAAHLARRADLGYSVVDLIRTDVEEDGHIPSNEETLARIATVIAGQAIDEVFVALPLDTGQSVLRPVVSLCEEQGITVRTVSTIVDPVLARAQIDEVDGRAIISIYTGPPDSLSLAIKRLIDLSVSVLGLVVLAPFFLIIAAIIKTDSRGPAFFAQERVGFSGRRFRAYKFRTMSNNAERQQDALEIMNEAEGPIFKIRDDPRITRIGRWLRRFSIDELPQLINVARGEMSLVGPRPLPVRDVSRIDVPAHKRRFSLRPGITCIWQVNGREPRFEEWIKADMEYIDHWSLALDLKILLKTIPAALSGRGAY